MIEVCHFKKDGNLLATLFVEKERSNVNCILMFEDGRCVISGDIMYPDYKTIEYCIVSGVSGIIYKIDETMRNYYIPLTSTSTKMAFAMLAKSLKAELYFNSDKLKKIKDNFAEDAIIVDE